MNRRAPNAYATRHNIAASQVITADLSRDGDHWLIYVPAIAQYTSTEDLSDAGHMARDLTATWLNVPLSRVTLLHLNLILDAHNPRL